MCPQQDGGRKTRQLDSLMTSLNAARMAEAMGIPLLDPKVDDPPHCDACCDAGR
jgi:hypothetical protein